MVLSLLFLLQLVVDGGDLETLARAGQTSQLSSSCGKGTAKTL